MTGNDLIRIIKDNDLGNKPIMLCEIPEDNYGTIMFMLKEGSQSEKPIIGAVCLNEPYFGDYVEYEVCDYWTDDELIRSM